MLGVGLHERGLGWGGGGGDPVGKLERTRGAAAYVYNAYRDKRPVSIQKSTIAGGLGAKLGVLTAILFMCVVFVSCCLLGIHIFADSSWDVITLLIPDVPWII